MLLCDAIRKGSKLRKQSKFGFNNRGRTCAIGAALHAVMGRPPTDSILLTSEELDVLHREFRVCQKVAAVPCGCKDRDMDERRTVLKLAEHLSDEHKWTRERIAEWIEGIEKP